MGANIKRVPTSSHKRLLLGIKRTGQKAKAKGYQAKGKEKEVNYGT